MAFPAAYEFDELDPYDDEALTLRTLWLAPLFDRRVINTPCDDIPLYVDYGRSLKRNSRSYSFQLSPQLFI